LILKYSLKLLFGNCVSHPSSFTPIDILATYNYAAYTLKGLGSGPGSNPNSASD
jgi:hypothetical protein